MIPEQETHIFGSKSKNDVLKLLIMGLQKLRMIVILVCVKNYHKNKYLPFVRTNDSMKSF